MGNLDRLKQEQAWAHIGDMEARIQWDHSVSQELSSRLPKYEQAIASYQVCNNENNHDRADDSSERITYSSNTTAGN